ncbi:MAG: EI24 domain-containing protein [Acetobacteraceae bacterium]|nr:EI24 domain-containing protein [Acetobacteraceae bacterium]
MLQPLIRAVLQLNDPVFLGVVWRSLALSLLAFVLLLAGSVWLVDEWAGQGGWLGWLFGLAGGLAVIALAIWLFVPVALLIATFYIDRVATTVERRFYPLVPEPVGAPLTEQAWDGAVLALQVLVLQIGTLIASVLVPGVGLLLGWVVTGWAIGRGLFVSVAMRRMSRPQALGVYAGRRLHAVVPGIGLAVASTFPPLNLLVPVVGIAAMVHVLNAR